MSEEGWSGALDASRYVDVSPCHLKKIIFSKASLLGDTIFTKTFYFLRENKEPYCPIPQANLSPCPLAIVLDCLESL